MTQLELALKVTASKEIDGLEMGVFNDGASYLTGRSLARLCGAAPSTIIDQANNWLSGKRGGKLAQMMAEAGIDRDSLFIQTDVAGRTVHAYPEDVCMLFLEYYALEIPKPSEQAKSAYRKLARAGLRAFIYTALGYDPLKAVPQPWRQFHDRITLVSAPIGYFSVFREMSDFIVAAIRGGLTVDAKTVPDISVGLAWASHWEKNVLDEKHGDRIRHDHNYPAYFPQAESNPQPIWVYPVGALGEFRIWLQRVYIPEKLPKYLDGKVRRGLLAASTAEVLLVEATAQEPTLIE